MAKAGTLTRAALCGDDFGMSDQEADAVLIHVSPLARVLHDAGLKRAIKVGAVSELALQPAQVLMRGCGRRGPTATATRR